MVREDLNDIVVVLAGDVGSKPTAYSTSGNSRFGGAQRGEFFGEDEKAVVFDTEFLNDNFQTLQPLVIQPRKRQSCLRSSGR